MKVAAENKTGSFGADSGAMGKFTLHHRAWFRRGSLRVGVICVLLTFCCSRGLPAQAAPAPAVPADLLAHGGLAPSPYGGEELFWVAQVVPNKEPGASGSVTRFFAVRASESKWQQWGEVPARAVSLASRGPQLAVLLDDGSWVLLSDDASAAATATTTATTGPVLAVPNAALVSFADDGRNLWALAKIPGGVARMRALPSATPSSGPATGPFDKLTAGPSDKLTTVPSTSPSATHPTTLGAAATGPSATQPQSTGPVGPLIGPGPELAFGLVHLGPDGWVGEADIPTEIARPGDELSLALIEGEPYLAARGSAGPVRVFRLPDAHHATTAPTSGPANSWALVCSIDLPDDAQDFQLLNGTPFPTVWARGRAGPDLLYLCKLNAAGSATPSPAVPLQSTSGLPPSARAAAYAMGLIRSVFVRDGELYEQSYDRLSGAPADKAAPLPLPSATAFSLTLLRYGIVTGAMLYAIGASFRRREQLRSLKIDPAALPLAPAGARLLAGAIDALPVIAAWAFYYQKMGPGELIGVVTGGSGVADPIVELVLWGSFAVYLAHTTICEVLIGRTLGKIIMGLRVISLDGKPPTRGQMMTRNLLRLIDAGLIFLPVLLVPFSPLRQRAGDTAAGTVVITAKPRPTEDHPDSVNPP